MWLEVAEPDKTLVEVEPVGCCFNHLYQLTSLGLPQKDVIFTVAEKGLPQVETWEMFKIPQKESGTDDGELFGWLDGYPLFERSHNNPLPPAPAQVGYG